MDAPRSTLAFRLAQDLPQELRFIVHHLSSPPTECPAIFSPPPGEDAEQTYCESHFLSVSVDHNGSLLQAFAIEALIYTTRDLTTLFISKADSTGYLHLLHFPKAHGSPLRTCLTTFLFYLVESRYRPGVRLVISLFARAQDQYLFPGSIENDKKHVLDDRGLIRWWSEIVDAILRRYPRKATEALGDSNEQFDVLIPEGYLKVPGCDLYETKSFLPANARLERGNPLWKPEDPLRTIGKSPCVPERCLIPRFPDDPKARFLIDLDDELPENRTQDHESPSKGQAPGKWRSVRSIEQFWEMMAFRQECAAGRLVGFIWGVLTPLKLVQRPYNALNHATEPAIRNYSGDIALPTPDHSQDQERMSPLPESPLLKSSPPPELPRFPLGSSQVQPLNSRPAAPLNLETILSDDIVEHAPSILEEMDMVEKQGSSLSEAYYWPNTCRGELVLAEADYKSVNDLLLTLDYADEILAATSTKEWVDAVAKAARVASWGLVVIGQKPFVNPILLEASAGTASSLPNPMMVRKKKRLNDTDLLSSLDDKNSESLVKVLSSGLVRKKPKTISFDLNGSG
ncbi:MAG: hypothetical protein Q9187_006027 [Circinaria calcarea]